MNLGEYVKQARGQQTKLAQDIGAQPQLVWQWANGVRPVPVARCAALELATGRAVARWDLRPLDWHIHWPELVGADGAPPVPAADRPAEFTASARTPSASTHGLLQRA